MGSHSEYSKKKKVQEGKGETQGVQVAPLTPRALEPRAAPATSCSEPGPSLMKPKPRSSFKLTTEPVASGSATSGSSTALPARVR